MAEKETHTLRNTIIGAVVAAVATALIPGAWDWIKGTAQGVEAFSKYCWKLLAEDHLVSGWLIFAGIALAMPTIFAIIQRIRRLKEPTWENSYHEDLINWVLWRWNNSLGQYVTPHPFCPQCDAALVYEEKFDESGMQWPRSINRTEFYCENCRSVKATIEGDREYAIAKISRERERRIRTGEWKQQITNNPK